MRLILLSILFLVGCAPQQPNTAAHIQPDGPVPQYVAWIAVKGESMIPTFPNSFLAEVDITYPYENLKEGDLVLFWDYLRTGSPFFTFHRIVGARNGYFLTQGDNRATNPTFDSTVLTHVNYLGKGTGRHTMVLVAPINAKL